jgi:hypothetical protein
MHYDESKIDEAALAVLYLTAIEEHGLTRAWKGVDWAVTQRLHERGFIDDPRSRPKSIIFTDAGVSLARAVAQRLFCPSPPQ